MPNRRDHDPVERYEDIAIKNIVPLLGALALTKLNALQISEAYAKALANGRRDGKGGSIGSHGASYAPHSETGAGAGRALEYASPQSLRRLAKEGSPEGGEEDRRDDRCLCHYEDSRGGTGIAPVRPDLA